MERPNHAEEQWKLFAATGSIYDYLDYKMHLSGQTIQRRETYADCDNGACSAAGQGGGSGSDSDDSYT